MTWSHFHNYLGRNGQNQKFSSSAAPYHGYIYDAKYEMLEVNNKQYVAKNANFTSPFLCSETKSQHAFGPFFAIIRAVADENQKFFVSCSVSMVTSMMPNMKRIELILSDLWP